MAFGAGTRVTRDQTDLMEGYMSRNLAVLVAAVALGACAVAEEDGAPVDFRMANHEVAASSPLPAIESAVSTDLTTTCTNGVTQFSAAQQIARSYCAAQGQNGNPMCTGPIVGRYCPEPWKCDAILCGEQLDILASCLGGAAPSEACRGLFPVVESTLSISPLSGVPLEGFWHAERGVMRFTGQGHFLMVPIPLEKGTTLRSVSVRAKGSNYDLLIQGSSLSADGTLDIGGMGVLYVPSANAEWHTYVLDVTDTTAGDFTEHWIEIAGGGPGLTIGAIRADVARLRL